MSKIQLMTDEEAKERIQSLYNDWLPVEYDFEVYDTEENRLDREAFMIAIKAIEAQLKNGKWIETPEGTVCSECGQYPYDDGEYHIANWNSDYCPNCGAKMEIKVPTVKAHKEAEP